jgi:beta-lactam-binding protein with PASTA domain
VTVPQIGILILENASEAEVISHSYFATLAANYERCTDVYGIDHPSLPNYLALTSGGEQGKGGTDSISGLPFNVDNVFRQLTTAGFTWKAYAEGYVQEGSPAPPYRKDDANLSPYFVRHDPAAMYSDTYNVSAKHKDFDGAGGLIADVAASALPDFFIVSPDIYNNGHTRFPGGPTDHLAFTNDWALGNNPAGYSYVFLGIDDLIAHLRTGGILIVTCDEGSTNTNGGGDMYCVVAGAPTSGAADFAATSSTFGILKAVQDFFGLPRFTGLAGSTLGRCDSRYLSTSLWPPIPLGGPPPGSVAVPDVIGMTQAAATTAITAVGLTASFTGSGNVASESPVAGTSVLVGSNVACTLSVTQVAVPNVVGMTQSAAAAVLTSAGLTSSFSGSGTVSAENPTAGTLVALGSNVACTLSNLTPPPANSWDGISGWLWWGGSQNDLVDVPAGWKALYRSIFQAAYFLPSGIAVEPGGGPAYVAVPNVLGFTQAAATAAMSAVGLLSSFSGTGTVATESPVAGTSVLVGSTVAMSLSVTQVSVPNVLGFTQAAAAAAMTAAGLASSFTGSGTVATETPIAGTIVAIGSTVTMTLTTPTTVAVPNVLGFTQAAADAAMTAAGLVSTFSGTGVVVDELPLAGTIVALGSTVAMRLSPTPPPPPGRRLSWDGDGSDSWDGDGSDSWDGGGVVVGPPPPPAETLIRILIAPGVDVLTQPLPAQWIDVTARGRGYTATRGKSHELDHTRAGTSTVRLDDRDRFLDDSYALSPWAGMIVPGMQVWVLLVDPAGGPDVSRFYGYLQDPDLQWPTGPMPANKGDAEIDFGLVDGFTLLSADLSAYSTAVLADNPAGYWRFNDPHAFNPGGQVPPTGGVVLNYGSLNDTGVGGLDYRLAGDPDDGDLGASPGPFPGVTVGDSFGNNAGQPFSQQSIQNAQGGDAIWRSDAFSIWLNPRTLTVGDGIFGMYEWASGAGEPLATAWKLTVAADGALSFSYTSFPFALQTITSPIGLLDAAGEMQEIAISIENAGTLSWYRDGALFGTNPFPGLFRYPTSTLNTAALVVGADTVGGQCFDGTFSNFAVYPSPLAAARVREHHRATVEEIPEATASAQITMLLDAFGWPIGLRDVGPSSILMQGFVPSGSLLETLLRIGEDSERGLVQMTADGKVKFVGREALIAGASKGTFADDRIHTPYSELKVSADEPHLYSSVTISRVGGAVATAFDAAADEHFGHRDLPISVVLAEDSDAEGIAAFLLTQYHVARQRATSMTLLGPRALTSILQLTIHGDRITVVRAPPPSGQMTLDAMIEGLTESFAPGRPFTVTYSTVPALSVGSWVLGKSKMGTETSFGF